MNRDLSLITDTEDKS